MIAQEVLVFDSSTFIEEAGLTSKGASALKHYLYQRGTQLVVPQIVKKECERKLANRAIGKKEQVEESLVWLGRFCGRVNGWTPPSDETIEAQARALSTAGHLGAVVLPETDALRKRAKVREKTERPPSHRRPSQKDCRIWEHCLELLAEHDVVFVAKDGDFRGQRECTLHPQLQEEVDLVGKGRSLTFHTSMASLLAELKSEIEPIPEETVFTFIYDAISAKVQELQSNSGCHPMAAGKVEQTLLTTDQAEVIEVRLDVEDTWVGAEGAEAMAFRLSGSCHYRLADNQLSDLKPSRVSLLTTQLDGSVRAIQGSYVSAGAICISSGARPVEPEQVTLD